MSNSIVSDGINYEKVEAAGEKRMIVIVDNRGLTFVGFVDLSKVGDDGLISIRDAQCIIRWGTSKHLAELANQGPLANTKLGDKLTYKLHPTNIYGAYECSDKWGE